MINRLLFLLALVSMPGLAVAVPIRSLDGLNAVIFYERTGGSAPSARSFDPNDDRLITRFVTLDSANRDFFGTPTENYDVFYSDADGSLNPDGMYLTIEALYPGPGGGFNIAEVELVYGNGDREYASVVTDYNVVSDNIEAATASLSALTDGDLQTHTGLGISTDQSNRLSATVGFASSVPEPAAVLSMLSFAGLLGRRRK